MKASSAAAGLVLVFGIGCSDSALRVGVEPSLDVGTIGEEEFVAVSAIARSLNDDSACKAGTFLITITSQSSTCEMLDQADPHLELLIPGREGAFSPSPDGECLEAGQDEFFATLEGEQAGTKHVTMGSVDIESINEARIRGVFAINAVDDPTVPVALSGAFEALRCP